MKSKSGNHPGERSEHAQPEKLAVNRRSLLKGGASAALAMPLTGHDVIAQEAFRLKQGFSPREPVAMTLLVNGQGHGLYLDVRTTQPAYGGHDLGRISRIAGAN
jgi:hypothetical protein